MPTTTKECIIIVSCALGAATACGDGMMVVDRVLQEDESLQEDEVLECGDTRRKLGELNQAIVNGQSTHDPTIVQLTDGQIMAIGAILQMTAQGDWLPICTGTLISPDTVLTAAHCVVSGAGITSAQHLAFAVEDNIAQSEAILASRVIVHPNYHSLYSDHDVAIIRLSLDATAYFDGIIPLPYNCRTLTTHTHNLQRIQAVGYGCTNPHASCLPYNTTRLWAAQSLVSISTDYMWVTDYGNSGLCYGDSGGPALFTMPTGEVRVIGTVHGGTDEMCLGQTIYINTSDNCTFINSNTGGCGSITSSGRCNGILLQYCDGSSVVTTDCSLFGQICEDDGMGNSRCIDEPVDPCDSETVGGRCEGNTAIYCDGSSIITTDCSLYGRTCGDDGTGNFRCIEEPQLDPCGHETATGRCDANVVVYCDGTSIITTDCSLYGRTCGDDGTGNFRCIEEPQLDPCGHETATGRCDANVVVYCNGSSVVSIDCGKSGRVCGQNDDGHYRCIYESDNPEHSSACGTITWEGLCDGNTAMWCDNGKLMERRCGECLQRCAYISKQVGYYCK